MSNLPIFRIEPCILVLDRVTVDRAVKYQKHDVVVDAQTDGSERVTWDSEKLYKNKVETKQAESIYHAVRQRLRSVCIPTEVGFICPVAKETELNKIVAEAKQLVEDTNRTFQHCFINFRVVCTKLEPTNDAGVDMLRETMQLRMQELQKSLSEFDVSRARQILSSAKNFTDVMADPNAKTALESFKTEAKTVISDMAKLLKDFDGDVQSAASSTEGQKIKNILSRTNASWKF